MKMISIGYHQAHGNVKNVAQFGRKTVMVIILNKEQGMSKLNEAVQKLQAALQPIHRRIQPMSTTKNIELNNNVDNSMTASVIEEATNQLHYQIAEWKENQTQLQEKIDELEGLINNAETARDAIIDFADIIS